MNYRNYLKRLITLFVITCAISSFPVRLYAQPTSSVFTEDPLGLFYSLTITDGPITTFDVFTEPSAVGSFWAPSFTFTQVPGTSDILVVSGTTAHIGGPTLILSAKTFSGSSLGTGVNSFVLANSHLAHPPEGPDVHNITIDITADGSGGITGWTFKATGQHLPEPGTILLLGTGLLGLGIMGRIREKMKKEA